MRCKTCLGDLQLKTRSRHLPLCSRAALMDGGPRGILAAGRELLRSDGAAVQMDLRLF